MIDKDTAQNLHNYLDAFIKEANEAKRDDLLITKMVGMIHEILATKRVVDNIRWRKENGLDK